MTDETIFDRAREIADAAERARFLDQACAGNESLRREVESLLSAHLAGDNPLDVDPVTGAFAPETSAQGIATENVGDYIGSYKLLQLLGEGGMGAVWVAEQEQPVKRRVALKLIKAGMDSAQVLRRFEAERQALALMDHTNIAKVLDAGSTPNGRPYFAMELVKGVPITKYCDELHLSISDRLDLFVPVCQAIQHAHQKGIIHRDIKPSNVLIAVQDGYPVPKVIDFGVAKAMQQRLTEQSMYTEIGQVIGTLEYMSPEQAELSALDIDTRADVYALGVLLYELLTGSTPLPRQRLRKAAFAEALRMIKEEEPPKPSTRLTESREAIANLAACRRTDPDKLSKSMRDELDWIVMKCLEKDRTRRYETANGLARDVQRFLADEPVEARPPSARYRLTKLARKNRNILATATAFMVLLLGAAGFSVWLALRARQAERTAQEQRDKAVQAEEQTQKERDRAAEEKKIAEAVRDFLQNKLLIQADPEAQADALDEAGRTDTGATSNPTIRELLDRAADALTPDKIETQFPNQRAIQAELLHTIGSAYCGAGNFDKGIVHLQRAAGLRAQILGVDHADTFMTRNTLGLALRCAGRHREALRLFEQLHPDCVRGFGPEDTRTLMTLNNLALVYMDMGRVTEAIQRFTQVRAVLEPRLGSDDGEVLKLLNNLALALQQARKLDEAIAIFEQVHLTVVKKHGDRHVAVLRARNNLGYAYQEAGRSRQAQIMLLQAADGCRSMYGPDHSYTLAAMNNLAKAYQGNGQLTEAIDLFKQAYDARLKRYGADVLDTQVALQNLGLAYLAGQRGDSAEACFRKLWDSYKRVDENGWTTFYGQALVGMAIWKQKKHGQAEPFLLAGAQGLVQRKDLIPEAYRAEVMTDLHQRLATFYAEWGKADEAAKWKTKLEMMKPAVIP